MVGRKTKADGRATVLQPSRSDRWHFTHGKSLENWRGSIETRFQRGFFDKKALIDKRKTRPTINQEPKLTQLYWGER